MADLGHHSQQVDQAHRLVQAPPNDGHSHFPRIGAMIPDSDERRSDDAEVKAQA
jgi:hypothetical protein